MSSPFQSKAVPTISGLLRERDTLIAAIERLEVFADHVSGCRGGQVELHRCTCGYGEAADTIAVLLDRIKREQGR